VIVVGCTWVGTENPVRQIRMGGLTTYQQSGTDNGLPIDGSQRLSEY